MSREDAFRNLAEEVIDRLQGSCDSVESVLDRMDASDVYTEDDIIDFILEKIEMCPECGWWVETWELVDDEDNQVSCDSCGNNIQ